MKTLLSCLFSFFLFFSFNGCQKKEEKKPQILVSIPAYENLLKEVLSDRYEIICVVPEGFNPHYFEVRPSDLNQIQNPKFWFGVNESFEPKLLESLKSRFPKLIYLNLIDTIHKEVLFEDHPCDHHHHHHHHHDHDYIDNHIWMSPRLLKEQIIKIEQLIPDITPQEKSHFQTLIKKLDKLHSHLKESLIPYQGQAILVSHPSFGYYCKEYDLVQISIECEGKQPMPKDLEHLAHRLENSALICVFAQVQFDQKGAILIAKKLHKPLYSIDPYAKDYFLMMEELNEKLHRQP
jgi:zinc transport system substrate-binding protein